MGAMGRGTRREDNGKERKENDNIMHKGPLS
jgi:hypothetical protein